MNLLSDSNLYSIYFALDPISLVRDNRVKETLSAEGVSVCSFNADLLYEPWEVVDDEGRPFNTFADFWERCLTMPYDPEAPRLPPKRIISGLFSSARLVYYSCTCYMHIHHFVPLI